MPILRLLVKNDCITEAPRSETGVKVRLTEDNKVEICKCGYILTHRGKIYWLNKIEPLLKDKRFKKPNLPVPSHRPTGFSNKSTGFSLDDLSDAN